MRGGLQVVLAAALGLVAAPAWAAPAGSPPAAAEVHARMKAILDDRFQKELPGAAPDPGVAPSSSGRPSPDGDPQRDDPRRDDPRARDAPSRADDPASPPPEEPSSPLGSVARLLLYALLAGVVVLIVAGVVNEIARRREGSPEGEAVALPGSPAARAAPPISLTEAEALALQGRHADAIHALLASVLTHLAKLGEMSIDPATTSREVLDGARLAAPAKSALADLVVTVEVSLFGGLDVGPGDFDRCMTSYRRLEAALSGR